MNKPEFSSTVPCHRVTAGILFLCLALSGSGNVLAAQASANPLGTLIFEAVRADMPAPGASPAASAPDTPAAGTSPAVADIADTENDTTTVSVDEYLAAISKSIEEEGLYSQTLSEQYESLGVLHYQRGEYDDAIAAFEDAIHIQKVNKGLFNLDQSRLVEYLIRTHVARGDFIAVDNHKHYLYYLQEKNLAADDPRLVAAKLDWADWNVEAYVKGYRESYSYPVAFSDSLGAARGIENRIAVNVPVINRTDIETNTTSGDTSQVSSMSFSMRMPMLNSNSVVTNAAITDYNLRSVPLALSNEIILNQRLHEAEEIYESLLEQMTDDSESGLQEQESLHLKIANINYLLKKELDQFENIRDQGSLAYNRVNQEYTSDASMIASRRYVSTKNRFESLANDIEHSPVTPVEDKAEAYIALGDLHLSFDRPQRALSAYQKALDILASGGYSRTQAEQLLTPEPTIVVPEFGIHNYSREFFGISPDTGIPYLGHMDVAFDKDRFGSLSGINVLAATENTPPQVRSALVDYLRTQRFRPAFSGGESVGEEDVRLRYYYYFQTGE